MLDPNLIADLRKDYKARTFSEQDVIHDPFKQFESWFQEALNAQVLEANAMTLATATADGKPNARIVLLKGFSHDGFTFFTNYDSRKGRMLRQNPHAALVFFWPELERQIRIEGTVDKLEADKSDAYFHSRPEGSRIGAHASPQSQPIQSRKELEERFTSMERLFKEEPIIRPKNWGGYLLTPSAIEFWQGRPNRLHDRFLYELEHEGTWNISRLAP